MRNWIMFLALSQIMIPGCSLARDDIEMAVYVVGEDRIPISEALVRIAFLGSQPGDGSLVKERTDEEGIVKAAERAPYGVSITVEKDGYYDSRIRRHYGEPDSKQWAREVVLREVKNPIPMYAKKVVSFIPEKDEKVAFDFTKGDWVTPYGQGSENHIYFKYSGNVADYHHYDGRLEVSFPEEGGGLFESYDPHQRISRLKLPHTAPMEGYVSSKDWVIRRSGVGEEGNPENSYDNEVSYFFRTNTSLNEEGQIASANYGKMYGDIRFELVPEDYAKGRGPGHVSFTYYYNPAPNDKNVEFDTKRNLLSTREERKDRIVEDP